MRGILAAQDHDLGDFSHGQAHQGHGEHAHSNGEQGHDEQGNDNHGDHRAAIAQGIDEFLAIDDADIAEAHGSTTFTNKSSRS